MSLTNKVAIVTGGSRGIGAGIAKELAKRGAKVLLTYGSAAKAADDVVSAIKSAGGEAVALKADCMDKEAPAMVIKKTVEAFDGGIDIIVNNAGAGDECYLKDVTYEHYDKVFTTNVRFPMFLVKESLPYLRKGGRIVNIGSVVSREGMLSSNIENATNIARLENAYGIRSIKGMHGEFRSYMGYRTRPRVWYHGEQCQSWTCGNGDVDVS